MIVKLFFKEGGCVSISILTQKEVSFWSKSKSFLRFQFVGLFLGAALVHAAGLLSKKTRGEDLPWQTTNYFPPLLET